MPKRKTSETPESRPVRRKKVALGRGLGALIPEIEEADERPRDFFYCDIALIRPNRFQPRLQYPEDELDELSQSIKEQGILQPLQITGSNGKLRFSEVPELAVLGIWVIDICPGIADGGTSLG